jgi:hypothetical protein
MAAAKAIAFSQVRLIKPDSVERDAAPTRVFARRFEPARAPAAARGSHRSAPAAPACETPLDSFAGFAEGASAHGAAGANRRATEPGSLPLPPEDVDESSAPRTPASDDTLANDRADAEDAREPRSQPAPASQSGGDAPDADRTPAPLPYTALPIQAIARAIEHSSMVRNLTDLIVNLCDGEESRKTGPWEMSLPLDRDGLGRSMLHLRLSLDTLGLRFVCDGQAEHDVLSSRVGELKSQLDERLHPPLEVSVELEIA